MSRGKHDTFKPTDETYRSGWDRVFNTNQTKELEDELAKKKVQTSKEMDQERQRPDGTATAETSSEATSTGWYGDRKVK